MRSSSDPIRVLLADDHTLVRAGIRALIEKMPGVQVAGEVGEGRAVLPFVEAHQPHLVLMDIGMPGLNGLEATERLAQAFPEVRVIILSMHQSEEYVWRALKAGASGYLLKKAATSELELALQRVDEGEVYVSKEISAQILRKHPLQQMTARKGPLERLTPRQREILQLIAEGQNTKEIADILKLSPKTVEYHRMKLMECLNVFDIPGLVRFALQAGVIPHES
jgi:DNA-binding NarL/FixJ family response regulator